MKRFWAWYVTILFIFFVIILSVILNDQNVSNYGDWTPDGTGWEYIEP